jgi:hypothetical protein
MFKLARKNYLREIFSGGSGCTGDCGQGRRCTCNPDREEPAGKPTNCESKLPIGKTMTRDDIIRMAREAGAKPSHNPDKWDILEIRDTDLERFAALVAAHERPWVGLTDEAIWSEYQTLWPFHPAEEPRLAKDIAKFARAIERTLKDKNT